MLCLKGDKDSWDLQPTSLEIFYKRFIYLGIENILGIKNFSLALFECKENNILFLVYFKYFNHIIMIPYLLQQEAKCWFI